jgi:predicted acylesterase/phospholipase RssA
MKRGLVLEGGGAKGAFAFGCLKAFASKGVHFNAVAGTSVGALNAALWCTGSLEWGDQLWRSINQENIYRRRFPARLERVLLGAVVLCSIITQFAFSAEHIPEADRRRLPLLHVLWPLIYCIGLAAVFPSDWANTAYWFLLFVFASVLKKGAFRFWIALFAMILPAQALWTHTPLPRTLCASIPVVILIVGFAFRSRTLRDSQPLAKRLTELAQMTFTLPCYATIAQPAETWFDRDSWIDVGPETIPIFVPATETRYVPRYERLDIASPSRRASLLLASAAMPLGIVPAVPVDESLSVDGGTADNTPVFPLLAQENCDEIWIVRLRPESYDIFSEYRRISRLLNAIDDIPDSQEEWHDRPVPWTPPNAIELPRARVLVISPNDSLGGIIDGTLNFDEAYAARLIELGWKAVIEVLDAEAHEKNQSEHLPPDA